MRHTSLRRTSLLAALPLLTACGATREAQLAAVAKDWCLAIRASQVMPVYPLTQDVQPGDVFLVRTPIEEQQAEWDKKGYLPLDQHVARLTPIGYAEFYKHSFPVGNEPLPLQHLKATPAWSSAPHAGFPSYSFAVRRGASLDLAVPVSGVPIGLGLLGASSADGTVSIGKARTLGVDLVSLQAQVREWAAKPGHREFLADLASTSGRSNYLRVVTRVYLTGELDISLRDSRQSAAGLDVGAGSPLQSLFAPGSGTAPAAAAKGYQAALDSINEHLRKQERGKAPASGSLRVVSATARTVALRESFDPPLVVGYLGFDCLIGPGGTLGPAVPTQALLQGQLPGEEAIAATPLADAWLDSIWESIYGVVGERQREDHWARRVVVELDALGKFVPPVWNEWQMTPEKTLMEKQAGSAATTEASGGNYPSFRAYEASLERSALALTDALARPSFQRQRLSHGPEIITNESPARQELAKALQQLRFTLDARPWAAAHAAARRNAADWLFSALYTTPRR